MDCRGRPYWSGVILDPWGSAFAGEPVRRVRGKTALGLGLMGVEDFIDGTRALERATLGPLLARLLEPHAQWGAYETEIKKWLGLEPKGQLQELTEDSENEDDFKRWDQAEKRKEWLALEPQSRVDLLAARDAGCATTGVQRLSPRSTDLEGVPRLVTGEEGRRAVIGAILRRLDVLVDFSRVEGSGGL